LSEMNQPVLHVLIAFRPALREQLQ